MLVGVAIIRRYMERIPVEALPQTIRDAFQWARKIGIQYLWVDSLCILQDTEVGKARE